MKFSTTINIPESDFKIEHESLITLMGSCFAESIGYKLSYYKFNSCKNPFGIIYNPISLAKSLKRIITGDLYQTNELNSFNQKWFSFDHHGSFSAIDKKECINNINQSLGQAHEQLKKSNTLIITFGSAWVYEYKDFGVVANCHKIPGKEFSKRLLSVKEILTHFEELLDLLKTFNPDLTVIFTVSPVRHTKDGLYENNLSKSTLHLAVKNLVEQHSNCQYFPAYEVVIDELRDYRFYKDDLVHPTEMGINYVWEKFSKVYFDSDTEALNKAIEKIMNAAQHIPFDKKSEAHQKFVSVMLNTIKLVQEELPFLDFEHEKKLLNME